MEEIFSSGYSNLIRAGTISPGWHRKYSNPLSWFCWLSLSASYPHGRCPELGSERIREALLHSVCRVGGARAIAGAPAFYALGVTRLRASHRSEIWSKSWPWPHCGWWHFQLWLVQAKFENSRQKKFSKLNIILSLILSLISVSNTAEVIHVGLPRKC